LLFFRKSFVHHKNHPAKAHEIVARKWEFRTALEVYFRAWVLGPLGQNKNSGGQRHFCGQIEKFFSDLAMLPRKLADRISSLFEVFPLVAILGPRQSGKTTLAKAVFPQLPYVSLENLDIRASATADPRGFLSLYPSGAIFDEIQNVPPLFSYLQEVVDTKGVPGQYVLTGSHNFALAENISQSLAGRIALTTLLPMSMEELEPLPASPFDLINTGFYPWVHAVAKLQPADFYANYIGTYVERDLRRIVQVKDLLAFQKFLRLCAGRAGQLLNLASLASDCAISPQKVREWISVLEASFILFLLKPNHRSFTKRLVKSAKLYFHDTGLLCHLLGLERAEQLSSHHARGAIFGNFIIADARKQYANRGVTPNLSFWQNQSEVEIDLVIETGEKMHAFEIKAGETMNSHFLRNLHYWRDLTGESSSTLLYAGHQRLRQDCIDILPWKEFRIPREKDR
jgi:predicted AAA+ superfamily ATPase